MRTLSVGCGGDFSYFTDFVDILPQRNDVIKCDMNTEKLPYEDNIFDEVYSKHMLEHLTDVGFAIREMMRVLKKGGKLTIITDNASFFDFARGRTHLGQYEELRSDTHEDRHYSLFTPWHLRNFFRKFNIKVEKIEYCGNIHSLLKPIAFILSLTPYWRMSKIWIKIEGIKNGI